MLCSKLSQSSMGPDIKGKNVYGKFPIPSHKLASLRSASKNEKIMNQRTLGGTHGAKPHFKHDIHLPLKT